MKKRFQKLLRQAHMQVLHYYVVHSGCCADESFQLLGARYDIERFGCKEVLTPRGADLLMVSGVVSKKMVPLIQQMYHSMRAPKWMMAVGTCACSGGVFSGMQSPIVSGVDQLIPVDVYVPGCPPRPEAILKGFLMLFKKGTIKETQK